jgi:hypothetical protein
MRTLLLIALASSTAYAEPPRRIALAIDPLALVTGSYTASTTFAINDSVAVTGEASFTPADDAIAGGLQTSREQLGVRLYLDRAFHGPFVEAGLRRTHAQCDVYTADDAGNVYSYDVDERTFGPMASVGWQWTFHDRWTLSYALTASKVWSSSGNVLGYYGVMPESNLRLGAVF